MMGKAMKGAAVAAAVYSLFAAGAARAEEKAEKQTKDKAKVVQCGGINACKGQGACAGAENACNAQNACKGQGWVATKSEQECKDKGGKVLASKM